jgi:CO dehydrogenase/acetyl-CoA synthase alpha subunit
MYIAQIPFTPAEKKIYDIGEVRPDDSAFLEYYPEIARCLACNTCTKSCPQDIQVMDYVQASLRGDIETAAKESFDCISCGLCAVRCPAEIVPYNIGQLARRLYSRYIVGPTDHVREKVKEVDEGAFDTEIEELKAMDRDELKDRYDNREMRL